MLSRLPRRLELFALLMVIAVVGCSRDPSGANSQNEFASQQATEPPDQRSPGESASHGDAADETAPPELDRALRLARKSLATLNTIGDYRCVFQRQERVGGELSEETRMRMKVRQHPFSVYMCFLEPAASAGQEVIYVEGRNDGKLLAHATGLAGAVGTVALDPNGMIAMRGGRYPITEAGMTRLVEKLLELGAKKRLFRESQVEIAPIEFAERPCTRVEIRNPAPVGDFRLAAARIVLDDQWKVPVHFEALEWPAAGGQPVLLEKYSYLNLELDVGLTDRDFDPKNPEYAFPE